jgi:hypothetical protein
LLRRRRRFDGGEIDGAALGLGDDFLRHHDDVAVAQGQISAGQRRGDEVRKGIAGADHRQAGKREQFQPSGHAGDGLLAAAACRSGW